MKIGRFNHCFHGLFGALYVIYLRWCWRGAHGQHGMQGKEAAAESEWNFACDRISVGCSRYTDRDWLSRIRRCTLSAPLFSLHKTSIPCIPL